MAEEYRPIKDPGRLREADDDDTVLAQGMRATAGEMVLEDPVAGPQTLSQLAAGGGGGEANTLANAGTGVSGVGSPAKVGLALQAKGHNALSGRIAVTEDLVNNNVDYDVVEANVIHQNLSGAGAQDHAAIDAHIGSTANPHGVTATQAQALNEFSSAPADEEILLSDGTVGSVKGSTVRMSEVGETGVVGDPTDIVEDDGGGTVRINAHTHIFKQASVVINPLIRVDVPLISAIAIPLDTRKLVGVDYNGGSPIAIVADDSSSFDLLTKMPLAWVSRDSTGVYPVPNLLPASIHSGFAYNRIYETEPARYISGLIIATSGASSDKLAMSAGEVYIVYLKKTFAAIDTNVSGDFDVYTGSTGGGFGIQTTLTDYPQNQYNNGTATPATLGGNRYGNIWWYLDIASGKVAGFLGTSNSTSFAGADAESVPTDLPNRLKSSFLIGRFVILRDTPASTVVESSFQEQFAGGSVTEHSSLGGLTTGDAGHTQLQLRSEKGAADGYASLNSDSRVVEPVTVAYETGVGTNLTFGAIADGETLKRVGSAIVGATGGGSTLNVGFRTRTTSVVGISTTAVFIDFNQADNLIDSFFTYSGGTFTAQKSFSALIYTEASMSWNSGTEPKAWVDIVKNSSVAIGTNAANVYSSLLQDNTLQCTGFASFVLNDTLRIYWYTTIGTINLKADTPKIFIIPTELS